eukprot:TRINITY_DN11776_c0_g1_i1.p1 TRINITY_DN11776_c0_g1~~TRINITY_DN11776_c0_g1_i1.p1  ORF type:complete len:260 (+),score=38.67 TRINITY_DN11776_c0_g1_i1:49-828(+)
MDCGYCMPPSPIPVASQPQVSPRAMVAYQEPPIQMCGTGCDDMCCGDDCYDDACCDYDECGEYERKSALEGNAARIAYLRLQLGLPVQPATRAQSQLSKASPENALKIKEIRERLGVPYLKSINEEKRDREAVSHRRPYVPPRTTTTTTLPSPEDLGARSFNDLANRLGSNTADAMTTPFTRNVHQQQPTYQPQYNTSYRPATTGTGQTGYVYNPPRHLTEWEKWDKKEVENPNLISPEMLGYQVGNISNINRSGRPFG